MSNETPPTCHLLERATHFTMRMVAAKCPNTLEGQFAQRVIDLCKKLTKQAESESPSDVFVSLSIVGEPLEKGHD